MKNTKKIVAVSGLSTHNLSAKEISEAMDWRTELRPGLSHIKSDAFDMLGLQKLVQSAINRAEVALPNNLVWWTPWHHLEKGKRYPIKNWVDYLPEEGECWAPARRGEIKKSCQNPVEYAARFSGWLLAIRKNWGLKKAIEAATSINGMGSTYTKVDPFRIFERFPSPHRAERHVWKVRRRANRILASYGISVSWKSLGIALGKGPLAIGKAALRVAEMTMNEYLSFYDIRYSTLERGHFFALSAARGLRRLKDFPGAVQRWAVARVFDGEFSCLREALKSADRLVRDEETRIFIDPETTQTIHGVISSYGWIEKNLGFGRNGCRLLFQQEGTGRKYVVNPRFLTGDNRKQQTKEAIAYWRRKSQEEIAKKRRQEEELRRSDTWHHASDLKKLAPLASEIIKTGEVPDDLESKISKITGKPVYKAKVMFACLDLKENQWQAKAEHDVVTWYADDIVLYFGRDKA